MFKRNWPNFWFSFSVKTGFKFTSWQSFQRRMNSDGWFATYTIGCNHGSKSSSSYNRYQRKVRLHKRLWDYLGFSQIIPYCFYEGVPEWMQNLDEGNIKMILKDLSTGKCSRMNSLKRLSHKKWQTKIFSLNGPEHTRHTYRLSFASLFSANVFPQKIKVQFVTMQNRFVRKVCWWN